MCQQNLIETLYVPVVFIFPDRKLNQNVYSGEIFNVNNEFNVSNVRN